MAGLFHVLPGVDGGGFGKVETLLGTDGKPLILASPEEKDGADVHKICTRQCLIDLDGDGNADLVTGNFAGTFAWFRGTGKGAFSPTSEPLPAEGSLHVPHHSDPWLVDWDGDGDLDLLSGSSSGGVFLATNTGTKTAPKFAEFAPLLPALENAHAEPETFGDAHLKGPQGSTRVHVEDVDGDGKLDLLVGDCLVVMQLVDGVPEAEAKAKLTAWHAKQQAFLQRGMEGDSEAAQQKWQKEYEALEAERETFARQIRTGFVWLYRRK